VVVEVLNTSAQGINESGSTLGEYLPFATATLCQGDTMGDRGYG
jgi:hypothetical protein